MANMGSFTQPCPSCEAKVPIKDGSLIGKKVNCPMCKYAFVVADPVAKDKKVVADKAKKNGVPAAPANKKKETAAPAKAGKSTAKAADKVEVVDDVDAVEDVEDVEQVEEVGEAVTEEDEVDRVEEVDEAITAKPKSKNEKPPAKPTAKVSKEAGGKKPPAKNAPVEEEVDESEEEEDGKKVKKSKKKKAGKGNSKLILGLAVAGVGLVVLAIAAFVVMGGGGDKPAAPKQASVTPKDTSKKTDAGTKNTDKDKDKDKGNNKGKIKEKETEKEPEGPRAPAGGPGGVALTNLLPRGSQSIVHLNLKDLFESPFGPIVTKTQGAFNDVDFLVRLGVPFTQGDDLYLCQSYSPKQWFFMVLHLAEPINDMAPLKAAIEFRQWPAAKGKPEWYVVHQNAAWLAALTNLAVFVPSHVRNVQPSETTTKPIYVHLHDKQTLLFGNYDPMIANLEVDGKIPSWFGDKVDNPVNPGPGDKKTGPGDKKTGPGDKKTGPRRQKVRPWSRRQKEGVSAETGRRRR